MLRGGVVWDDPVIYGVGIRSLEPRKREPASHQLLIYFNI